MYDDRHEERLQYCGSSDAERWQWPLVPCVLFLAMWLFSACVEARDIYYLVECQNIVHQTECNPIGRLLIWLGNGNVALFMSLKALGMALALAPLPPLLMHRRKLTWLFLSVLFTSRLILLIYLETGHLWS